MEQIGVPPLVIASNLGGFYQQLLFRVNWSSAKTAGKTVISVNGAKERKSVDLTKIAKLTTLPINNR
jgi:hypothetical protein